MTPFQVDGLQVSPRLWFARCRRGDAANISGPGTAHGANRDAGFGRQFGLGGPADLWRNNGDASSHGATASESVGARVLGRGY